MLDTANIASLLGWLRKTAEQLDPLQRWYRILSEALKPCLKGRQLNPPPRRQPHQTAVPPHVHEATAPRITSWDEGQKAALDYLARYAFRIAITNRRILAVDDNTVTYRYKDRAAIRHHNETLCGHEFIRRLLQHVLPASFHELRYYGLWHASRRTGNLRNVLLFQQPFPPPADADAADPSQTPEPRRRCPHCDTGHLTLSPVQSRDRRRTPNNIARMAENPHNGPLIIRPGLASSPPSQQDRQLFSKRLSGQFHHPFATERPQNTPLAASTRSDASVQPTLRAGKRRAKSDSLKSDSLSPTLLSAKRGSLTS